MKNLFFMLIIFSSCNEGGKKNEQKNSIDNFRKSITGKWGDREGNLGWNITKDSIYYFNENRSYYYIPHNKDIIVLYKEEPYLLRDIHVIKDTLYFKTSGSGQGEIKAFRIK